jgi:hypothetical protein
MRSAAPLPPSVDATARQRDRRRQRARGQRDRAVEPGHLLEPVEDAQHELPSQPERQRPHHALAIHAPWPLELGHGSGFSDEHPVDHIAQHRGPGDTCTTKPLAGGVSRRGKRMGPVRFRPERAAYISSGYVWHSDP